MLTLAKELHAPARRNFQTRRVVTTDIDDLWQADLVEMSERKSNTRKRVNKNYKYILTVIDTFSKYAWAVPLKTKTAEEVTAAIKTIFKKFKRHPKLLHTDEGKEFFNSKFQALMKEYKIRHYNTYTSKKASVVERFNRTLKEKMWRYFTANNTIVWHDILQDLVDAYNNSKHRTIGMKPVDVSDSNKIKVLKRLAVSKTSVQEPNFKVGDIVRISKTKKMFDKSYIGNWTEELFKIIKIKNTTPIVYSLVDMADEAILGTFYGYELKKTQIPNFARIEKVIQKKKEKGVDWIKVKWVGYDNKFNSWIKQSDSVKL